MPIPVAPSHIKPHHSLESFLLVKLKLDSLSWWSLFLASLHLFGCKHAIVLLISAQKIANANLLNADFKDTETRKFRS